MMENRMEWRIRESRNGWYAEMGIEIKSVECSWKPGYTMPGFLVYKSARFDTKRQAERYIEQHSADIIAADELIYIKPDPEEAATDEEEEETPATTAEATTVARIIRRKGGYRERDLLNRPHTMTHSETWNADHKVVNVLESTPDPDGYRAGCAVDIVTRSIVG